MITDDQYKAFLLSSKSKPVVTVDFNSFDGAGGAITLRASSRSFKTAANIYRSRLVDFVIRTKMSPGVAGFSEVGWGDLKIVNADGKLDGWRDYRHGTVTIRRGDESWDIADHRTEFTGIVNEVQVNKKLLTFSLLDDQQQMYELKDDTAFILTASSKPGTLAKEILTSPNGPFAAADLDIAAFDQLDIDYPYNCTITPSGRTSAVSLMDELFNGFPIDYGQPHGGKITVFNLINATGISPHRKIRPVSPLKIKRLAPMGEVTMKNASAVAPYDSTTERATIKSDYPNYRSESYELAIDTQVDADLLAAKILDLHNAERDEIKTKTRDAIYMIHLADEVQIEWDRYGYETGKYGVVLETVRRLNGYGELVARV